MGCKGKQRGEIITGSREGKRAIHREEDGLKKRAYARSRRLRSFSLYGGVCRSRSSRGISDRCADAESRHNSAVRAEIRTRGVVHENKNCRSASFSILDPCVCIYRNCAGGAKQGQRSGDTGG